MNCTNSNNQNKASRKRLHTASVMIAQPRDSCLIPTVNIRSFVCLKSDPIWIFPFIYLFSSFSKSEAFSAVGCNLCFWLFPLSPSASEWKGWCGFLTINTQRGKKTAVWSPSWEGHGPFSASGTCFLLPRTFINHAGWIMGKGPHMKRFWCSLPNSGAAEDSQHHPGLETISVKFSCSKILKQNH